MRSKNFEHFDRIMTSRATIVLTINDLRILLNALNALEYFGMAHGEDYLDEEGVTLMSRIGDYYETMVNEDIPSNGS